MAHAENGLPATDPLWERLLGQGQKPLVMSRYPHMLSLDRAVWTAFLELGDDRVGRCWYDVKVGAAASKASGEDDREFRIRRGTLAKRIDVVFDWDGRLHVCEVKPFGNHAALGQAAMYRGLFLRQFPEVQSVVAMICCGSADEDLGVLAEELDVLVVEVGDVFTSDGSLEGLHG